jgi:arginyl-tRNA synthetase
VKSDLQKAVESAIRSLGIDPPGQIPFERPRQEGHGDLTTTVAMVLAKSLRRNPRELAAEIVRKLPADPGRVAKVEVAGAGFINFTLTQEHFRDQLRGLIRAGDAYGRSDAGAGKRVQVEFVSANPTGPLTVGHGRGAVFGDTVSRLLEWTGHAVEREYYFNNAGRQMRILGDSVRLRYLEALGDSIEFPQDYYQGEYIREIARRLEDEAGGALRGEPAEGAFKARAEQDIFADIRKTLERLGIEFDRYFNEHSLYTDGKIDGVIAALKSADLAYEQEGALWFRTSALGLDQDKVIVKSTGEPTYRLPDIAYHREKFARGFDQMIDIFGADHIATYPDVLAGVKALGLDATKVKVLIHQFVTITQGGEVVKMSTRKANFITLDELIDEVGADAVRYFFNMRTIASHMNFDLDLAKKQSDENPVYYLQYAHARICSILRYAEEQKDPAAEADLSLLRAPEEAALVKSVLGFPDVLESCALSHEPHRLAEYLQGLAGTFHSFYAVHRVVGEDARLSAARLALVKSVQIVIRNGLSVLGVSSPEKM